MIEKPGQNRSAIIITDSLNTSVASFDIGGFRLVLPGNSIVTKDTKIRINRTYRHAKLDVPLLDALKNAMHNADEPLSFMLSGGIDSSVLYSIAMGEGIRCNAITVGTKTSEDFLYSATLIEKKGGELMRSELTDDSIKYALRTLRHTSLDVYSIILGIVEYAAMKHLKSFGYKTVVSGMGSDELFFGFAVHKRTDEKNLKELRERRLSYVAATDIFRITSIGKLFGMKVCAPYLSEEVVDYAMSLDLDEKGTYDKGQVRSLGRKLGIPEEIVNRRKNAMQYSSGLLKRLHSLAEANKLDHISDLIYSI
jgi:asparagine synthase (glutamine-hydrolysing)